MYRLFLWKPLVSNTVCVTGRGIISWRHRIDGNLLISTNRCFPGKCMPIPLRCSGTALGTLRESILQTQGQRGCICLPTIRFLNPCRVDLEHGSVIAKLNWHSIKRTICRMQQPKVWPNLKDESMGATSKLFFLNFFFWVLWTAYFSY